MQFLTAKTILYLRVIFLITISYLLVQSPELVGNNGFALLMGQAMQVKYVKLEAENPLLGICSFLFFTLAISDIIPLLAENIDYFETVVPTRLTFYFGLAAFSYFAKTSIFSNNLVFVYSFFEIWVNFLIFNNLKDEKYYRIKKFAEENAEEIKRVSDQQVRIVELE